MSAAFQAVLPNVTWKNSAASPALQALQQLSPQNLSIRFNVDSYQWDSNQANFTYGRVVGTIGPALPGEAPRSTPRRLAPIEFNSQFVPPPSIFSTYGPAGAVWDAGRGVLILDLGNCVPTAVPPQPPSQPPPPPPSVPADGWPIVSGSYQLTCEAGAITSSQMMALKTTAPPHSFAGSSNVLGNFPFDDSTYSVFAGVVEVPVDPKLVPAALGSSLTLTNVGLLEMAVQEDSQGRYVDVDVPFLRLNPKETAVVTLWATKFGSPWSGANLPVALQPPVSAQNAGAGGAWNLNDPPGALTLSPAVVVTGADGTGKLTLTASDPGTPRKFSDGPGPDGQVYGVTCPPPGSGQPAAWPSFGQIFLFPGSPINVLVFSSYTWPARPTWDGQVGPLFAEYAKLYRYMKGILDLSDYDVVKNNAPSFKTVLCYTDITDAHYMPVVRDLSADKRAMIQKWFDLGMPKS